MMKRNNQDIDRINCMTVFNVLGKTRGDCKRKTAFGKKEYVLQLLVGFGSSGCKFHVFFFYK